jgi:hypothetical protein
MPVTPYDAQAITQLVRSIRSSTPGAGPWDDAGVMAALKKVAHLDLAEVTGAALRAAADKTFSTPGGIANTSTSCWRPAAPTMHRAQPIRPSERCRICSQPRHRCEVISKLPGDGHVFTPDTVPAGERLDPSTGELIALNTTDSRARTRAAANDAILELANEKGMPA